MWADFHWHARDWQESEKETVKRSLELAYASGGLAIGVMPNTRPPLTTLELCKEYLKLADEVTIPGETIKIPAQMYVHIALMADIEQVKRAVEAMRSDARICGMKMYFGHSTNNFGIAEREIQYQILETLVSEGYTGVLVGHFEKQNLLKDNLYEPKKPITWSTHCRPEIAEIAGFAEASEMLEELHFAGKFHVAHVSTLPVVDYISTYQGQLQLSCGVTPHHFLLDNSCLEKPDGAWYKCNPPLRNKETQQGLLKRLLEGKISIIESDHAPHTSEDKAKTLPASGIASGMIWPEINAFLKGRGMSEQQLNNVCFNNVLHLYGLQEKIPYQQRKINATLLEALRNSYPSQPFAGFFEGGAGQVPSLPFHSTGKIIQQNREKESGDVSE